MNEGKWQRNGAQEPHKPTRRTNGNEPRTGAAYQKKTAARQNPNGKGRTVRVKPQHGNAARNRNQRASKPCARNGRMSEGKRVHQQP